MLDIARCKELMSNAIELLNRHKHIGVTLLKTVPKRTGNDNQEAVQFFLHSPNFTEYCYRENGVESPFVIDILLTGKWFRDDTYVDVVDGETNYGNLTGDDKVIARLAWLVLYRWKHGGWI